jgi:hypothetical protein
VPDVEKEVAIYGKRRNFRLSEPAAEITKRDTDSEFKSVYFFF